MRIVPETNRSRLEFYEAHLEPWSSDPASIGLSPSAVTALQTRATEAREAYEAHLAAQQAARAAASAFHDKVRALHADPGAGADMIQSIKNFASTTDDPGVYTRAQLPAPAAPSSAPMPGTPFRFAVELLATGAIKLSWKCENHSAGTMYEVRRRVQGAAVASGAAEGFTFLGTAGVKRFTDDTLPAGSTAATYEVTAVRSTGRGYPARFTVSLGVTGGVTGGVIGEVTAPALFEAGTRAA